MQGVDNRDKVKTVWTEGQDVCVCVCVCVDGLECKGQSVKFTP